MKFRIIKMVAIIVIIAIYIMPTITFAAGSGSTKKGVSFGDAKSFIDKGASEAGKNGLSQTDLNDVGKEFVQIAQILVYIGAGILVASTAYMGIKYMMASPEQQAKLKQQLIGLVVSALVVFGAYFIWSTVYDILNGAFQ